MTSAQVVETSVTNNSSFQNYPHPDDHTIRTKDLQKEETDPNVDSEQCQNWEAYQSVLQYINERQTARGKTLREDERISFP